MSFVDMAGPLTRVSPAPAQRKTGTRCAFCGAKCFAGLDMGAQPAEAPLLSRGDLRKPATMHPLRLMHCTSCGLTQLGYIAPATVLRKWGAEEFGEAFVDGKANAILPKGVLTASVSPAAVLGRAAEQLTATGVLIAEEPYWLACVRGTGFPRLNHRRLQYLALRPLAHLFSHCGLDIFDVELSGGVLRVSGCRPGAHERRAGVAALLQEEEDARLYEPATVLRWAAQVERRRREFQERVWRMALAKRKAIGIGACAATAICNYCRIGPEVIDYIADTDPHSAGRYVPGVQIPILAEEQLFTDPRPADVAIVFAGDAEDETVGRWRVRGWRGEVIVP